MAVVLVKPLFQRSSSKNEKYETTYELNFEVITDDPKDGGQTARFAVFNAYGIKNGTGYSTSTESDPTAFCTNVDAACNSEDGKKWIVKCVFGRRPKDENPLNHSPKITWSFTRFERPVDRDIHGAAILNTAGDPFLNVVMRDDCRPLLSVTRNVAYGAFSPSLAYAYSNATNANSFMGAPPGTVKLANISASNDQDQNIGEYWIVSYDFEFNVQGWKKVILNQGMRQKKDNKFDIIAVNEVPITTPMLLDNNGKEQPPGGTPVWLEFEVYPRLPFNF